MRSLVEKEAQPLFNLMLVYTTTSTIAMLFTLYIYTQLSSTEKCVDFFNVHTMHAKLTTSSLLNFGSLQYLF